MTDAQADQVKILFGTLTDAAAAFSAGGAVTAASDPDLRTVDGELSKITAFLADMLIRYGISPVEARV